MQSFYQQIMHNYFLRSTAWSKLIFIIFCLVIILIYQNCGSYFAEDELLLKTGDVMDNILPELTIIEPTVGLNYSTSLSHISIKGTASDNSGKVTLLCFSSTGVACNINGSAPWVISNLALSLGTNVLTIIAKDSLENTKSISINITRSAIQENSKCTKYVSQSGAVKGKIASKTIQSGIDSLVPGDTLCVDSGVYNEVVNVSKSGIATKPITIRALDSSKKPVIDGQYKLPEGNATNRLKPFYSNTECYEVWQDPKANLGPAPKQACWTWGYLLKITASYIIWDGINLTQSRGHALLLGNYSGPASAVQSIQFLNSEISQIRSQGVYIGGATNVTFKGNVVRDTNDFATYSRSAPNIIWSGDSWTFNGGGPGWGGGIYLRYTNNITFENNRIYHNWGEGLGTGLYGNVTTHTYIKGNEIYDNFSGNLYLTNGSFVNADSNIIYSTGDKKFSRFGYTACISFASEDGKIMEEIIVTNNIIYGCTSLLAFGQYRSESRIKNIQVINNTLWGGHEALHTGSTLTPLIDDFRFINNLVTMVEKITNFPSGLSSMIFSHNLWPNTPPESFQGSGDVISTTAGLSNPNYKPSPGIFDPTVIKLIPSSAALNKGVSWPLVKTDFFGKARPLTGIDIGAHEQ